jgi:hypothetical protein
MPLQRREKMNSAAAVEYSRYSVSQRETQGVFGNLRRNMNLHVKLKFKLQALRNI